MGTETQEIIVISTNMKCSSSYYGNCELCDKHVSEIWMFTRHRVYVRLDGTRYLSGGYTTTFGHKHCLDHRFGESVNKNTLARSGNVLLSPQP